MSYAQRLENSLKKQANIRKWKRRVKKSGKSHAAFCRGYQIDPAQFSKWVNWKLEPSDENVHRVERALEALGV